LGCFFLAQAERWWWLECSGFLHLCGGVALCNRNGAQRNEDCNVPQSGGIAKSVTEKNNRRAGEGSAYKRQ